MTKDTAYKVSAEVLTDLETEPGGAIAPITQVVDGELIAEDTDEEALQRCEEAISKGLEWYFKAGLALKEISERKLYRLPPYSCQTFERYCEFRWGIKKSQGYRLITAAEVVKNLSPIGDILPAKESHARPLTKLDDPELQRKAWQLVLDLAGTNPTAKQVEEAVEQVKTGRLSNPSPSNEMYTPMNWVERFAEVMGSIDLDPSADLGRRIPAKKHYTKAQNGLKQPWPGRVFVNPPYNPVDGTSLMDWALKTRFEWESENADQIILLLPGYTSEGWWHCLLESDPVAILQIKGRLQFEGTSTAARFPSVVVYFSHDDDGSFHDTLSPFGKILTLS